MKYTKGIESITWHLPYKKIEDIWGEIHYKPGLYIIRLNKTTQRLRGRDRLGSLYIGKSKKLGARLHQFCSPEQHSASGLLWSHPKIANIALNKDIKDKDDITNHIGKLTVKFSLPIPLRLLNYAEMALIFAYMLKFGEPPSLNSSIPGRWKEEISNQTISWAEKAILE